MFDMFKMLGRIGEIKEKMAEVKAKLGSIIIEESELDGTVVVQISADKVIRSIQTSAAFYEKYSVEERQDILVEAVNNAIQKAEARSKEETQKEMQGVLPEIPGLDLSNMPFSL